MTPQATVRIPVGVVVERHKAVSPWLDAVYRPVSVLPGAPVAAPWTPIAAENDVITYYAGQAVIELYRTETLSYQENLGSGNPLLWVALRPRATDEHFELLLVTADPAEGEALTGAGNDLIAAVTMPGPVARIVASFIAEHPPERSFFKRERDRSNPRSPERRHHRSAESGSDG